MKLNNERGIAFVLVAVMMACTCFAYLKGAEAIDHNIINKDKWKTHDHIVQGSAGSPGSVNEWHEKGWDVLKVETNDKSDANGLPPGLTVNTNYVAGNKSE